jgi:pimeloyl-ACP methyl ester carboxylesterase
VLAFDLPGFGQSPPLPDGVEPSPAELARAVAGAMDACELGERVHVVGNSLGGWIAFELGKLRRAATITALCPAGLWGGPLLREGQEPVTGRGQRVARQLRPIIPVALLSARVRRTVLAPFVAHPERVPYRDAWRMVSSYARASAYAATNVAMRRASLGDLSAIDVPVTVGFGEQDRLIRPRRVGQAAWRTVILEDCGHIPMFDAPELVVSVIEGTVSRGTKTWASGPIASA